MLPRALVTTVVVLLTLVLAAGTAHARKEPKTGINFKSSIKPPGAAGSLSLMGVGARVKEILMVDVNVYAVGMYVAADDFKAAAAAWQGKNSAELRKDAEFRKKLLGGDFDKSLRLVMARSVDGDTMRDAFDEALKPRTKKLGGSGDLGKFRSIFSMDELDEGVELLFTCKKGGTLVTSIGGKKRSEIASPGLCAAFFDIYVGTKPVSGPARSSFHSGLAKLLK